MPAVAPPAIAAVISLAAASGATTGLAWSCARAVVANNNVQSATACSTVSNSSTWSRIWSAPEAARLAWTLGQPSRGLTMRSRVSPKLPIARATMPMFSPSCGSTRMTTGPASVTPDLVLSVPEPDISLHFLIQGLKSLNQAPKDLIQRLSRKATRLPVWQNFSSNIIGLVTHSHSQPKPQMCPSQHPLARARLSDTLSIKSKVNPKADSTVRGYG